MSRYCNSHISLLDVVALNNIAVTCIAEGDYQPGVKILEDALSVLRTTIIGTECTPISSCTSSRRNDNDISNAEKNVKQEHKSCCSRKDHRINVNAKDGNETTSEAQEMPKSISCSQHRLKKFCKDRLNIASRCLSKVIAAKMTQRVRSSLNNNNTGGESLAKSQGKRNKRSNVQVIEHIDLPKLIHKVTQVTETISDKNKTSSSTPCVTLFFIRETSATCIAENRDVDNKPDEDQQQEQQGVDSRMGCGVGEMETGILIHNFAMARCLSLFTTQFAPGKESSQLHCFQMISSLFDLSYTALQRVRYSESGMVYSGSSNPSQLLWERSLENSLLLTVVLDDVSKMLELCLNMAAESSPLVVPANIPSVGSQATAASANDNNNTTTEMESINQNHQHDSKLSKVVRLQQQQENDRTIHQIREKILNLRVAISLELECFSKTFTVLNYLNHVSRKGNTFASPLA